MKKFILGIIVGAVLFVPVGVKAWGDVSRPPIPKSIYQFNPSQEGTLRNEVAVFDDSNNKCYVSFDRFGAQSSISCVKK